MRLTAIHANRHLFEGQPSGTPIRLLLRFADSRSLRIGVAGDRFRAMVDRLPLDRPFDVAEYGQVDVADVTDMIAAHLRGAGVTLLHALTRDGHDVGVRLGFDANMTLNIWVDGDELHWGDAEAFAAHDWLGAELPVAGSPIGL
ncbi:hypothetical protein [Sphingomonas sp.]|uniref:hypothetical protein n=2 Tax=unclassified Sphingomonas TaxID=196159 RepID=UPI00307FA7FF